jgi:hypothetical protein
LGENVNTIKKNTQIPLQASKETDLGVNKVKNKNMSMTQKLNK